MRPLQFWLDIIIVLSASQCGNFNHVVRLFIRRILIVFYWFV
jgi:hypothetical protein